MPFLSPQTLTLEEQETILRVTAKHSRDNLIFSMALGTGLRLSELVGLNVADVYHTDGTPKSRVRVRAEIAKRGTAGDVFVPDRLVPKLVRFNRLASGFLVSMTPPIDLTGQDDSFIKSSS